MNGCLKVLGGLALLAVIAVAALFGFGWYTTNMLFGASDPVSIARSSLEGLREQNKLSPFEARYVAVVTSSQSRLGLTAQKTLIMPGLVRYEVDLARLQPDDVRWDAGRHILSVQLPPVEVDPPQVDFDNIKEYGDNGLLMLVTDAGKQLDAANRTAGEQELTKQAMAPAPMNLAREAARRAIERSFAMPLKAAGVDATVNAFFPDEQGNTQSWDVSRSLQDVYANKF